MINHVVSFLTKADLLKWKFEPKARDAVSVNSVRRETDSRYQLGPLTASTKNATVQTRVASGGQDRRPRSGEPRASALEMTSLRDLLDAKLLKERAGVARSHPAAGVANMHPVDREESTSSPGSNVWGRGESEGSHRVCYDQSCCVVSHESGLTEMEVRAEGSRRGFSKLGTTRNRQSLPIRSPHGKHQKCYRTDKSRERRSRPPPALRRTSRISARDDKPS